MSLDTAQAKLAEAIAALEAADVELEQHSVKGMTTRQAFQAMQGPAFFMPKRAAEAKRDAASRAVTAARVEVTRATYHEMLEETRTLLPVLRAEYEAAQAAWEKLQGRDNLRPNRGTSLYSEIVSSRPDREQMELAFERLSEVESPLNKLAAELRWTENAQKSYAEMLEQFEFECLDYTEHRENHPREQRWEQTTDMYTARDFTPLVEALKRGERANQ